MGVDSSSLLDQQVASSVANLLTRSAMYQILSACFLYPEEKNLSILKGPDFQEHVKDVMLCYEDIEDGAELKNAWKKGIVCSLLQPLKPYKEIIGVL